MDQFVFVIANETLRDVTLTLPMATAPRTIPVGQRATIAIPYPSGSVSYGFGNLQSALTLSWSFGRDGRPTLEVKSPPARTDGLVFRALLDSAFPALAAGSARSAIIDQRTEDQVQTDEGLDDGRRLSEGSGGAAPYPTAAARLLSTPLVGIVHLYVSVTITVTNRSAGELALTLSNSTAETLFASAKPEDVTPPPVLESQATKEFCAFTWPKGFAKYAVTSSNWKSSWVEIRWDSRGVAAAVMSMRRQGAFLRVATCMVSPGGDDAPAYSVTIDRAAPAVPVAPIVGTNRDVYQTRNAGKPFYTVGHAHTKDRMVLGIDISSAQRAMDFKALSDFVDTDGRRVWFVGVKVFQRGVDSKFPEHWRALSQTRLMRMPYVFLDYLESASSRNADNATLQRLADERFDKFKAAYIAGGGWRPYDLPAAIDFEPERRKKQVTGADGRRTWVEVSEQDARQDAWTLLPVMRTFIRRMTAMFGTPPIFYSGSSYLQKWYPMAKLGMAQERPDLTWDDAWLDPVFDCRVWHSEYPERTSPTADPSARNWPWPQPRGYAGARWLPARWDIYQFGIARAHGLPVNLVGPDANPQGDEPGDPSWATLPEADGRSFGTLGTGTDAQLDLDVWNGSLPELVELALQTRWNPNA